MLRNTCGELCSITRFETQCRALETLPANTRKSVYLVCIGSTNALIILWAILAVANY